MNTPVLRILVTGATGYIGGRLAPLLVDAGHRVRVLARTPDKLRDVPWAGDVEIVRGDLTDPQSLAVACRDVDVLYYLVHSMGGRGEFIDTERAEAENVAAAARAAGVRRIVYLGGLHPDTADLSTHLRSREQVGRILVESGVPTLALQAGVVIGSGSASFEMIRHLSNRLPLMTTPKWVNNKIQPIAVRDVLHYLVGAATAPLPRSRTYDIGGPDVLRYGEMMQVYAEVAGLRRRRILVLPVLTPKLAGLWIGLTGYREAVGLALHKIERGDVETTWASASPVGAPAEPLPSDPHWAGEVVFVDERRIDCDTDAGTVWEVVESIGGENGWYSFPLAWTIRGWLDRFAGGVGLSRGRRNPRTLHTGDALDFWRVERLERPTLLRLRAEMRAPGGAWRIEPLDPGRARLHQRAIFFPKGLAGRVYWYALVPFHGIIFKGMLENIAGAAHRAARDPARTPPADPMSHPVDSIDAM
ncbi:MAG: SDR family oxidoreductase [Rhodococcus ruber]|nr:SDR family oxidoreductase [Rhodococcus ruber]